MVAGLCHFVFSRRKDASRKEEKTPCQKTKRRKNAMRKDEITPCEKTKPATRKGEILAQRRKNAMRKDAIWNFNFVVISRGVFRLFAWRLFVFSLGVISSCRLFAWRLFVFSRRKDAMQKDEKTTCEKTKRRHAKRREYEQNLIKLLLHANI